MKILVTGATGQVGRFLLTGGATPLTRQDIDMSRLSDADVLGHARRVVAEADVVVNCAAWTDVDGAEDPANAETVNAVNAVAPGLLAEIADEAGASFIHVSTDYVFSGDPEVAGRPWQVADQVHPANEYGRTKALGEQGVLAAGGTVARTSWVWSGPHAPGRDFVTTMVGLAERGVDPKVVDDQVGRPTYAADLAAGLLQLAQRQTEHQTARPAVLHFQNSGEPVSWCGLARAVFERTGHDPARVSPCSTADWPTPAARPPWSILDLGSWESAVGVLPPAWQDGLDRGLGID